MSVQEDRRDAKSQRIPFETIVELGDDDPGAAFEAQGVNLSATGMQLRTAYLPERGQALLCRFGSGAQEIQAEAEVVWRKEAARGGEFGIRFTNVDGVSAAALWDMCGVQRSEPAEDGAESPTLADEGTRVRLHIEGLTSPMKARVRGAVGKELLVGSNLEFLKVGRALELENVDQGGKRPAHIDRVDVELDKESRVPQLVVTLRYDDMSADPPPVAGSTSAPCADVVAPAPNAAVGERVAPASQPIDPPEVVLPPPSSGALADLPASSHEKQSAGAAVADERTPEEIELAKMMRSRVAIVASDAMVKVADLGLRAKSALGAAITRARQRSPQREGHVPRRKTSPPPGGALHASGKRVVREGAEDAAEREEAPARSTAGRKAMMAVGGGSALVVIAVVALLSRGSNEPPPGAETTAEPPAAVAVAAVSEPSTSGGVEANVPLFGSTTIVAADAQSTAATAAPVTPIPGARPFAFSSSSPAGDPVLERTDTERRAEDKPAKPRGKAVPFGHGKVERAMVFRIKTDGTISDLHGTRSSGGFTLTMPGRRTLETGSALAARDPRIASVRVANNAKGSELTFQFKGSVPPFLVSPNGRDLQLALSRPEETRNGKDAAHRSVTAQKRDAQTVHRSVKR